MAIVIKNGLQDQSIIFGSSDGIGSGTLKPGGTQSLTGPGQIGWDIYSPTGSGCVGSSFIVQDGHEYVIGVTVISL
jgi:hypothetical protein